MTPVSEHLDPTNPEQFRIDFSSIPTSVEPLIPTIPPTPNPVPLEQQGHSTQHMPRVEGAHALHQAEAVVLASTSKEHTPTNTSESIVSAETSITSDKENDTTQVENTQQHTHGAIASDPSRQQRNVIINETVMNQFLDKIVSEHYIDFDVYHPGLELTSTGYKYNPQLMTPEQTKSLNSLLVQMQTQPNVFQRLINKFKTVTSS